MVLPKKGSAPATGLWLGIWQRLRSFLEHFLLDVAVTLCILAGLAVFWGAIKLLAVTGYPVDSLQKLEQMHFIFTWVVLLVISVDFVLKLTMSLWKNR
jgi:hypothetical protein